MPRSTSQAFFIRKGPCINLSPNPCDLNPTFNISADARCIGLCVAARMDLLQRGRRKGAERAEPLDLVRVPLD